VRDLVPAQRSVYVTWQSSFVLVNLLSIAECDEMNDNAI
jgi:hypothetical protein